VPSIADVAALAGVSAQTVSLVSTGSPSVRASTRERVLKAMTELGYAPNRAARALRVGTVETIGIVTQRLSRTGDGMTAAAVATAAQERGYSVSLVEMPEPDPEELRKATHRLSNTALDGLVMVRAGHTTADALPLPANLPVVVADSRLAGHYPSVVSNEVRGTQDAVEHLLGLGHRTVHHIAGSPDAHPAAVRMATWRRCLAAAGLEVPEPLVGAWTPRSGYEIGRELAADSAVTAVFCANDEMAFGLIRALREAGRRVPDDVSVVGFDDLPLSDFSHPPLTTVSMDFERLGRELVRVLAEQLSGPVPVGVPRVVLPTRLSVRASTAPPRRG
jgi:DNA-binding LacI/PurR family transcriptional regulator